MELRLNFGLPQHPENMAGTGLSANDPHGFLVFLRDVGVHSMFLRLEGLMHGLGSSRLLRLRLSSVWRSFKTLEDFEALRGFACSYCFLSSAAIVYE